MPATPQVMANIATYGTSKPPVGLPPAPIEIEFEEVVSSPVAKCTFNNKLGNVLGQQTMNSYVYTDEVAGQVPKADFPKIILGALLWGRIERNGTSTTISAPFVLTGLGTAITGTATELAVNSSIQRTIDELGKPVPHKGDIVCVTVQIGTVAETNALIYLSSYVKFKGLVVNATGSVIYNTYVGVCNATQTDFVTPFNTADTGFIARCIISPSDAKNYL